MTCILGIKRDGKIYMGTDSLSVDGWHRVQNPNPKIFRVGDMLIGTSGSQRLSDILQYNLAEDSAYEWLDPAIFIARRVIPAMRTCLKEHGMMQFRDGQEKIDDDSIMIGYKGHLFIVGEDFSMSEIADYEAIGVGARYALGYIYAMRKSNCYQPEELLTNALACAVHFCIGCAGPFVIDSI